MGFRPNTYAKVWSIEQGKGNFQNVKLSISHKDKMTGQYETDFSDYCMFIGDAQDKVKQLKGGERIMIKDVDVSNKYDKALNKMYYNFKVFDFEMQGAVEPKPNVVSEVDANDDGKCPF